MLIKGTLAQKIIKRPGLGKTPTAIRDHIKQANVDEHTKKKLLDQYERLRLGKPIVKHDLKEFLHTIGDKKVMTLPGGTYVYTIAHNPEKVLKYAEREERVERHERIMEQQHERDVELAHDRDEKREEREEEDEKKKGKEEHETLTHTPAGSHAAQNKGGKEPLPKFIGKH